MTNKFATSLLSLSLLAGAACDAQVDSEYRGEPLATLSGEVVALASTSAVNASLVWSNFAQNGDTYLAAEAPVSGEFPAQFTLDVFLPPPTELLNHFAEDADEVALGLAYVVAFPQDYDATTGETPETPWGISAGHVLAYVPADLPAGSSAAEFAGAALTAGFHVLEVVAADDPACAQTEGYDCLRPAPAGLSTSITITIDEAAATEELAPNLN